MNLFKKQQTTIGYNSISDDTDDDDDTAVVPIVFTTILPLTLMATIGHSLKWWMVAIIVEGMLLLVAGCGAVWMQDGALDTTTAEGLIVATKGNDDSCVPAGGTFSGTSTTTSVGEDGHF